MLQIRLMGSFSHALQNTNVIEDHALPAREDMSITTDM